MQVGILLVLAFSVSLLFGEHDHWGLPIAVPIVWAVVVVGVMLLPYFRLPCADESSTFD